MRLKLANKKHVLVSQSKRMKTEIKRVGRVNAMNLKDTNMIENTIALPVNRGFILDADKAEEFFKNKRDEKMIKKLRDRAKRIENNLIKG